MYDVIPGGIPTQRAFGNDCRIHGSYVRFRAGVFGVLHIPGKGHESNRCQDREYRNYDDEFGDSEGRKSFSYESGRLIALFCSFHSVLVIHEGIVLVFAYKKTPGHVPGGFVLYGLSFVEQTYFEVEYHATTSLNPCPALMVEALTVYQPNHPPAV